jgi:hypothetical protein
VSGPLSDCFFRNAKRIAPQSAIFASVREGKTAAKRRGLVAPFVMPRGTPATNVASIARSRIRSSVARAMLIKRLREFAGDLGGVTAFDLIPLEHVNQFAIFQQRDRRR